jgi:hypothetical protein
MKGKKVVAAKRWGKYFWYGRVYAVAYIEDGNGLSAPSSHALWYF